MSHSGRRESIESRRVYDRRMAPDDLTAFVLAGGKSTRMGQDKAFVKCHGRTLVECALNLALSVTSDVRIVGNARKFGAYATVIEDTFPDCGPLGGIHAALLGTQSGMNLMLAVDMPFLSPQFLQFLIATARDSEAKVIIPRAQGHLQPLCAIYRREFLRTAEKSLLAGRYKINPLFGDIAIEVIEEQQVVRAGFSPLLFRNLNKPQDLQEAADFQVEG
jgi:molybdenum cofactor guanylyltransferase